MESAQPRFFMDRGLGSRIVPGALREAGWLVVTMDERYGVDQSQLIDDVTWIREASERGECVITKDAAVARRPAEAEQIIVSDARVFAVASARLTGEEMARLLLRHSTAIHRWATKVDAPFACAVRAERLERLTLRRA